MQCYTAIFENVPPPTNQNRRSCIEVNGVYDTHAAIRQHNCQAKQEDPLFSFLRQTTDEELPLLVFKNKMKIVMELLRETRGGKQFLVPLCCSLLGLWGARKIWSFSLQRVNECYIGRTWDIALHQMLYLSSSKWSLHNHSVSAEWLIAFLSDESNLIFSLINES